MSSLGYFLWRPQLAALRCLCTHMQQHMLGKSKKIDQMCVMTTFTGNSCFMLILRKLNEEENSDRRHTSSTRYN